MLRADGEPIIPPNQPHNCYYKSGWNRPYSHTAVAVILTNTLGDIAAVVARKPDEPEQGGKLALPGGYVEFDPPQTLVEAAEAEVREETGYAIVARSLARFAIVDGPTSLPGRQNENNGNIVHVYTALADEQVQEHDDEVTAVHWIDRDHLPPREKFAFGHFDIIRMWHRHQEQPFEGLPIVPSGMTREQLFLPDGLDA
jgi:ADP-ribose pyrophosphatase YjhB (NUDIX family)